MLILTHSKPHIDIDYMGRRYRFSRARATRGEASRSLSAAFLQAHIAHITMASKLQAAVDVIQQGEITPEAISQIEAMAVEVPSQHPVELIERAILDLSDHLILLDGEPASDLAGREITPDLLDSMLASPEAVVELWQMWFRGNQLDRGEREKSSG